MRIFSITSVFIILSAPLFFGCTSANSGKAGKEENTPCMNALQMIDGERHEKKLERDEAFLYKAFAIFDGKKLPDRYRSPCPIKDGTIAVRELKEAFPTLSDKTRQTIAPYLFPAKGGTIK